MAYKHHVWFQFLTFHSSWLIETVLRSDFYLSWPARSLCSSLVVWCRSLVFWSKEIHWFQCVVNIHMVRMWRPLFSAPALSHLCKLTRVNGSMRKIYCMWFWLWPVIIYKKEICLQMENMTLLFPSAWIGIQDYCFT